MNKMQELKPGFAITGIKPYYNEKAKLPNKKYYAMFKHIEVPFCDVEIIKKVINNALARIEGVRGNYNELKFIWELEYGTKPIERTIDPSDYNLIRIIKQKKYAALFASEKALDRFPHNADYNDYHDGDEFPEPVSIFANPKWSVINILLSYDEEKNVILVEFNRLIGDHASFHIVSNVILSELKKPELLNWIKRVEYLKFTEGIKYDNKYPTLRYLCDDMISRELCTYL